jgi:signal transduction histidine kinase
MTYPAATGAPEEAALRRVATLVAEGVSAADLLSAVAEEVAHVLDVPTVMLARYEPEPAIVVLAAVNDPIFAAGTHWPLDGPSVSRLVFETGQPARIDDYAGLDGAIAEAVRRSPSETTIGAPIVVDGRVWGVLTISGRRGDGLGGETHERLSAVTELVAVAISNAASRARLERLADEQAALRRIATQIAEGVTMAELGAAVLAEVTEVLSVPAAWLVKYEPGDTVTVLASRNDPTFPPGSTWPLDGESASSEIKRTGAPVRIDDYSGLDGTLAANTRESGIRSVAGVPVVVDGAVWGCVCVGTGESADLPADTATRLDDFTQLVATAIANTDSRDRMRRLADEQAALHRVARLVARGAKPGELFSAVSAEVSRLLDLARIEMVRYDTDGSGTVIGATGEHPFPVGSRWTFDGPSIMERVFRTGLMTRIDDYRELPGRVAEVARGAGVQAAIGAPIAVDGATWGAFIAMSTTPEPIPKGAEVRLALFAELIATAVDNLQAHDDLRGLADEQAALRRVATLVAEGARAEELFSAVATEVADLLDVPAALLDRFEPDRSAFTLAVARDPGWTRADGILEVGIRWPPQPGSLTGMLHEVGRAVRIDDTASLSPSLAETWRVAGIGAGCAAPIVVDGTLWGALRVYTREGSSAPSDTEARLGGFTELVATAVSNAAARAELNASRARIVAAGDDARRRIERDLHDGTQQRLIALGLDLQRIRALIAADPTDAVKGLVHVEDDLQAVLEEIRDLSSSLHPPLLSRRGFVPALRALARRSPIPVDIDVELRDRPPAEIETALYYLASEVITNAIKYSQASTISIVVETDHAGAPFGVGLDGRRPLGDLHATITDDGVGGADVDGGSGLTGLIDRVDALGGRFTLDSPAGRGTRISVVLPLGP